MISHFNLGTNYLACAEAFYDELLKIFNGQQAYKAERTVLYALGDGSAKIAINKPFDGKPATAGNGSMVAFSASGPDQVKAFHLKALELGGSSDGEPGERMGGHLYAAYVRDLDGNKIGIFCTP
jgi:predicted lactoylglutathione lyase